MHRERPEHRKPGIRASETIFRYFPQPRQYDTDSRFRIFSPGACRVRFIGGFGQIYWVEPEEFKTRNPFSFQQGCESSEHMNKDHADALRHYAMVRHQ
jgi:hypothetical protein